LTVVTAVHNGSLEVKGMERVRVRPWWEVLVMADAGAHPEHVAADLLSQARRRRTCSLTPGPGLTPLERFPLLKLKHE